MWLADRSGSIFALLLFLGAASCVSGERSFVLQALTDDRAAIAVGSNATVWASSLATRDYFIIPGGRDRVPAEIVSFEIEPAHLLEGRAEHGYLHLHALAPGSARITVRADVLGKRSEASISLSVSEIAGVDWHVEGQKVSEASPTLLAGHFNSVRATPVDEEGAELFAGDLHEITLSEGIRERGGYQDSTMIVAEQPTKATLTFGDHMLELGFVSPASSRMVFDRTDSGFAIGRPVLELDAPLAILPRHLRGTVTVLTSNVCTTRIEPFGEDEMEAPWQNEIRVRPIENVRSGTCRLRVHVETEGEPISIEEAFEIESLFPIEE